MDILPGTCNGQELTPIVPHVEQKLIPSLPSLEPPKPPVEQKFIPTLPSSEPPKLSGSCCETAAQLKRDVERIVLAHWSELNACLDVWICNEQRDGRRAIKKVEALDSPSPEGSFHSDSPSVSSPERKYDKLVIQPKATATFVMKDVTKAHTSRNLGKVESQVLRDHTKTEKSKVKRKKSDCLFLENRDNAALHLSPLQWLTSSFPYEMFSIFLILSNAIFIGWHTQHIAERARDKSMMGEDVPTDSPSFFITLGLLFTLAFAVDLALRWIADGFLQFFRTNDVRWNIMDIFIVFFGCLDAFFLVADLSSELSSKISVLRMVRVVRIVRVAKVIRVMHFFRELRIMIFSILGSLKPLLWIVLVLGMQLFVFGIVFTGAATENMNADNLHSPTYEPLFEYFGTLDSSVVSLFMAMSGGNDWGVYYDALKPLEGSYRLVFLMFITFSLFAVVNIVTGVFVDAAMQANLADREIIVHEELESKRTYLQSMKSIFEEMDSDSTGSISLEEFERRLDDERVIAYFNHLKLDVSDAHVLFELLDHDNTGDVTISEFLTGCYRLQGESRSMDLKIMQCAVDYIKVTIQHFIEVVTEIHDHVVVEPAE